MFSLLPLFTLLLIFLGNGYDMPSSLFSIRFLIFLVFLFYFFGLFFLGRGVRDRVECVPFSPSLFFIITLVLFLVWGGVGMNE